MHALKLHKNLVIAIRTDTFDRPVPDGWMDVASREDRETIEIGMRYAKATDMFAWPEPTAKLTALASSIQAGDKVVLRWETQHAVSASIDQGVGPLDPVQAGELEVAPAATTTYQLTAMGREGTTPVTVRRRIVVKQ